MSRHSIVEITRLLNIEEGFVVECVRQEWLRPVAENEFDDEDMARLGLILELRELFGVNDESLPIILHLLDQIHYLRRHLPTRADQGRGT